MGIWAMGAGGAVRWLVAAALLAAGSGAEASVLVAPSIGGRNAGLVGNDVATPLDGAGILISNPAGVVEQSGSNVNYSLMALFFTGHYTNSDIDYDTKSSEVPVAPTLWLSTDRLAPWHVGAGLYGSVGASFNFPGNPAAGVPNRFFSELTILQLGLVVGREIAPGLDIAIQPEPTYGKIRAHYGTPLGPASFDIDGAGITGSFGMLYHLNDVTTLGVKYRGPGIVYLSGGANVGPEPDHVDLHLHLPQAVYFGFAHSLTPRLLVAAQARWTDYAQFTKGQLDYRVHSPLDRGPITDARATFRYGLALEYALVAEHVWLRGGASRESWMMEPSSLSPLLYDTTDILCSIGLGVRFDAWTVDMVGGLPVIEDRVVTPDENPAFPGRYGQGGGVVGISIAYHMD